MRPISLASREMIATVPSSLLSRVLQIQKTENTKFRIRSDQSISSGVVAALTSQNITSEGGREEGRDERRPGIMSSV
jgi:hypothetical protein